MTVLVLTYRKQNAAWIEARKLYNLPLPKCGKTAFHERVERVVLIAEGAKPIAFEARFREVVDSAWLKANGYAPPPAEKRHGESYALYELREKVAFAAALADPAAEVFVASQRCPRVKIDAEFYNRPYPKTGGRSMPHIFDTLKPYFKKWHSAVVFNPVQTDFFDALAGSDAESDAKPDIPFPPPKNPKFTFIDLFAGIGGFHLALEKLGGKCVFASEWDSAAKETYKRNFGIEPFGDITKIDEREIPAHDVLCAGFPCQPFSKAGRQAGFNDETKGTLFFDIERILRHHKTKYIVLENVRNLVAHDGGRTWKTIFSHLRALGYRLTPEPIIVSPHYFGVPQIRERVIILGVYDPKRADEPLKIELPKPMKKDDCRVAEILESGDVDKRFYLSKQEIAEIEMWDKFHSGVKEKVIGFPVWAEWFKSPPEADMPEWKADIIRKNNALYLSNQRFIDDWMKRYGGLRDLTPTMRKMEWQAGADADSAWDCLIQKRPSGLRIKRATCAPALVAIVQVPIVAKYRRRMTVREAARLQSFPDEFIPNANDQQAYKQFGNAVNVTVVAECAKRLFENGVFHGKSL